MCEHQKGAWSANLGAVEREAEVRDGEGQIGEDEELSETESQPSVI
jgi:hypothetical protein